MGKLLSEERGERREERGEGKIDISLLPKKK